MSGRPVIIDCDPGIDDAIALLLALASPEEIDLLGITCVAGNVPLPLTLRNARMYEFLDRFINIAVPRIRDFRGLPNKSFDGRGNYTLGIKEQMIFPEIDFDKVEKIHGMDITIVTNAGRDDLAMALLREFGWPFRGETPLRVA